MYGTTAEATTYHQERGNAAWAALSPEEQTVALTKGSDLLDSYFESEYIGRRAGGAMQDQGWPRVGLEVTTLGLGPTDIPTAVRQSAFDLALLWKANPTAFDQMYQEGGMLKRKTVGPITKEWAVPEAGANIRLPQVPALRGKLAHLLRSATLRPSGFPVMVV